MKTLLSLIAFGTAIFADAVPQVTIDVPFSVRGYLLPAGTYSIVPQSNGTVMFQSPQGRTAVFSPVQLGGRNRNRESFARLRSVNGRNELIEVWMGGRGTGYSFERR